MKKSSLLLALALTGCASQAPIPMPAPIIKYCKPGEVIGCRPFTAADNGATVRGHSEDKSNENN